MGQLSVTINDRNYTIACDDGQEERLSRLSDYLNTRVDELVSVVGQVGDARLLVMLGLLIADELSDAYAEISVERGEEVSAELPQNKDKRGTVDNIAVMENLADRMEAIAGRLEGT